MLTCRGCMKRCLQTIIGSPTPFATVSTRSIASTSRRTIASEAYSTSRDQTSPSPQQDGKVWDIARSSDRLPSTRFEQNRQEWLKSRGTRPASKANVRRPNLETESSMKKHFQYLQDPLKLADYIRRTLRNDDFETAEKVVQYASKTLQCVVSWNHLVDWQLSKGRMNAAIKTLNEMKKRSQTPDAHTYTIIFRGCAEHKDSSQALEKVLVIYHSMFADKCPVKPNTIHVNAVLKMCSKARNLDAMFAIVDHLPEKGLRAPNNLTYTTILNALRMKLIGTDTHDTTSVQQRQDAQNSIMTARHIWSDIVKRWRKGDIWIDEELVCSMGRLLLMGNDQDADDVLSLIEQSMSIPRQAPLRARAVPPRLQSTQKSESSPQEGNPLETAQLISDESTISATSNQIDEEVSTRTKPEENLSIEEQEDAAVLPFTETVIPVTPPKGVRAFPIPGQNTLSLLMAALLKLRDREAPRKYWSILTSNGVVPDAENYNSFLRTLRVTRSSSETVKVLLSMPKDHLTHGTFRIAMATCVRDKNNPHAFSNAGKILDLLQTTQPNPDPKALETYLELSITSPVQVTAPSPAQEADLRKLTQGAQIIRALNRLGPSLINLKAILAFGDDSHNHLAGFERTNRMKEVLKLTQRMVSAYDIVVDRGMSSPENYWRLIDERKKLSSFVTRTKLKRSLDIPLTKIYTPTETGGLVEKNKLKKETA